MTDRRPVTLPEFDFTLNPEPRLACVILTDCSSSMSGAPIEQLNRGLDALHRDIAGDALARKRIELCIVRFGGRVSVAQDFATVDQISSLGTLSASGNTPMAEAITMGLDLIEARKGMYRAHGLSYYRPWIWTISDGAPTSDITSAAAAMRQAEASNKVTPFSLGVDGADFKTLATLGSRPPLKLDGLRFTDLFLWLSRSLRATSVSRPGEDVALAPPDAAKFLTVKA